MKIDKTYIINLESRKDRRDKIIKELTRVGITNYEIFKAIRPKIHDVKKWNKQFLNPIPQWFINTGGNIEKYKIGCLGCMLSHYEILKDSIKNKYNNILILEDDTAFTLLDNIKFDDNMNMLESQINSVNTTIDMLYLCGNHRGSKINNVTENILKIDGTLTTGSYIINNKTAKYIVDNIHGYTREIDVYYANVIQKVHNCYVIYPHMTRQTEGYSDIVQREVSYKL